MSPSLAPRHLAAALLAGAALWGPALAVPAAGPTGAALAAEAAPAVAPAPSVTVATARMGTLVDAVVLTGTLVARDEVLVAPEVDGLRIVEILAEEGDRVAKGQVLLRLSRDAAEAQLAQAEASVARAEASISQARAQITEAQATRVQAERLLARARSLQGSGATSTQTLEDREASARIAVARVASAEQALRLAEADLALAEAQRRETAVHVAQTEIKAPVDGIVSRRMARVGALASMAGEAPFRLIAGGAIELRADVPETELARLKEGQPASVVPAGAAQPIQGQVRLVAPEVDATSRLGRVRVSLPPTAWQDGGGLALGAFGRATVEIERRDGVLVPLSAVLYGAEGAQVQVVRDGTVETRRIALGLRAGGKAEVRSGLAEGEQVVSVSGTFVRDGDRVTPVASTR
jgi:RND family efflux transporter MFP subunit